MEWPPAMSSKLNGARAPGTLASNHAVTASASIPLMSAVDVSHRRRTYSSGLPVAFVGPMPAIDVTDATFEAEVIERSAQVPVVVDLWAEWCGPCKTLGPIIEKVVDETGGKVVLAKVDVDANPQIAQALRVQSIPAVFVARDRKVVQGFIGAQPEPVVRQFVESLLPTAEEDALAALLEAGDEASLRKVLEVDPGHERAVVAPRRAARAVRGAGRHRRGPGAARPHPRDAPRPGGSRRWPAWAPRPSPRSTTASRPSSTPCSIGCKDDEEARQEYVDVLELLGPDDPRTAEYRKPLTSRLF